MSADYDRRWAAQMREVARENLARPRPSPKRPGEVALRAITDERDEVIARLATIILDDA